MEGGIAAWYARFASGNGLTLAEARRMLTGRELEEFKWDVREYIRRGQEKAVFGQWAKQLENASCRFHISRLEALKVRVQNSLEELCAKYDKTFSSAMQRTYESGYYHTAFELQKGFGIGWDIASLNQREVEKVLAKLWAADGYNFSQRIWRDKEKLISTVHTELSRNIALGQDPQKAIDRIAKIMDTGKGNAGRLVMTESAYFSSAAQGQACHDLGVEQYEILATLDSRTSQVCRDMDGKRFAMKDFQAGVTAPPFHVRCRSTTIPYDPDFGEDTGQRAARGKDGKTYYVPADMTYREWEKTFVGGGEKTGLTAANTNGIVKGQTLSKDGELRVQTVGHIDRSIYCCVTEDITTDEVIITDTQLAHIRDRHPDISAQVKCYLHEALQSPDYILETEKPNTANILKRFSVDGKGYQLVLRLKVSGDPDEYKNSVITFMSVNPKRWEQYLRNRKILYKRAE